MRRVHLFIVLLLPLLAIAVSCNDNAKSTFTTVGNKIGSAAPGDVAKPPGENRAQDEAAQNPPELIAGNFVEQNGKVEKKKIAARPRKIRTSATMYLIVDEFPKAAKDLKALLTEFDGEEENAEINTSPNSVRTGVWKIRVPVAKFDGFRDAVAKIGDVEKHIVNSEDMTDKFYDLQADIEDRKSGREALRDLLKDTGKKDMKNYVDVWDKLQIISGEINRKEGLLKSWENLTERTTCTVHLREKQPYVPAPKVKDVEEPTFGMRIDNSWTKSWEAFIGFCQMAVLVGVALTPWLPIPLLFLASVWVVSRVRVRAPKPPVVVAVAAAPPEKKE